MGRRVGAAHCRRTLPLLPGCRQSGKTLLPKAGLTRKRKVRVQRLMDFDRHRTGGCKNESRTRGLPAGHRLGAATGGITQGLFWSQFFRVSARSGRVRYDSRRNIHFTVFHSARPFQATRAGRRPANRPPRPGALHPAAGCAGWSGCRTGGTESRSSHCPCAG